MATVNSRKQHLNYSRYFKRLSEAYAHQPVVRASMELLLTLFTISFFSLFALRPTLNAISELVATIQSQQEIQQRLQKKLNDLSQAQSSWNQNQTKVALLDEALPKDPRPDTYIQQIERLAINKGLTVSFLKVDEVIIKGQTSTKQPKPEKTTIPGTAQMTTSLSVTGAYTNILAFLEDLEKLRRIVNFSSITFGTIRENTGTTSLILTIANQVPYYSKEKVGNTQ